MLEPSGFREVAKTAHVTYPIPFIVAILLAFAVILFGMAIWVPPDLQSVLVKVAIGVVVFAIVLIGYTVLRQPALLRSERHAIMERYFDIVEDSDLGARILELGPAVLIQGDTKRLASNTRRSRLQDSKS